MELNLVILLLLVGVLSFILLVYYGVRWLMRLNSCDKELKSSILSNLDINYSNVNLKELQLFEIAATANNAGPNHCDIEFDSSLYMLSKGNYSSDFVSTLAKDRV